jgi:HlyD family secretion protein
LLLLSRLILRRLPQLLPQRVPYTSRAVAFLSLALAVLLPLAACKKNDAESSPAPVVTVQTAPVQQTDLVQTVESEATLYPINQASITPKISAPVKQFYVNRGSRVKQGQLLAVLENRDLSAAAVENHGGLEQAQAAYSSATGSTLPQEWKKAELDVEAARQTLEAEQKLYDSRADLFRQGALPRKELDQTLVSLTQARNQYEIAKQHLDALQAVEKHDQLKSAKGQLEAARGKYMGAAALLQYSQIHSPISGVVADRPLYPGETATAGVPLLIIVDSSQIIAKAHLAQEQAALVKLGDAATLTVPGGQNPVAAKVTVVSPTVDANSTTIEIWVQAANPEGTLRPGTSAHLSIAVATVAGALIVPANSVLTSAEGKTSVMLVGKDNIAHSTEVKTGIRQGDSIQIVEGLKPGDGVVASGAYGLPDGARIQTSESKPPESKPSEAKPPAAKPAEAGAEQGQPGAPQSPGKTTGKAE